MKYLFIGILFISLNSHAKALLKINYGVTHLYDSLDANLDSNQAIYEFQFSNLRAEDINSMLHFSIDGREDSLNLNAGLLKFSTSPGKHVFEFLVNETYEEVVSDSLEIHSQQRGFYQVMLIQSLQIEVIYPHRFDSIRIEHVTYKPVIYLYPEVSTSVDVRLSINGENHFFYPKYENGWHVTAHPNGSLAVNGENYRYLFWEALQDGHLETLSDPKGYIVQGTNALQFLEEKLTAVGFTSEEKADFITFWGPQLAQNEKSFVRFEWNDACDKFATLDIEPKPDHVNRFYIFIAPTDNENTPDPQQLPVINRSGFSILEWGGQISKTPLNLTL